MNGTLSFTFILVSTCTSTALSLPPNLYTVWLILSGSTGTSDFLSLNLAISESLLALWVLTSLFAAALGPYADRLVSLLVFSRGLFYTARPLFQCCICVECYVGVVHPLLFLRWKPLRHRAAVGCAAWLLVSVSCVFSALTYADFRSLYLYFIQNVLFLSAMLSCGGSVLRALRQTGPGDGKRPRHAMKRKAFKIVSIITTVNVADFLLCVAAIPMQCCLNAEHFSWALTVCGCMALVAGISHPLLYLHRAGKLCCGSF